MFKITNFSKNVVKVTFEGIKVGWEQDVLLSSDRHHDNLLTDWNLEKKHLDQALRLMAPVVDAGDLFCAMQGKYDPRKSYDNLRPEHKGPDYLDRLVETAYDFYRPYKDILAVLGRGNHETSVLDRTGTDLTARLVKALRQDRSKVMAGGFGGWVWFQFMIRGTVRQSLKMKYYHGAGANAPVSRGVLEINRLGVFLPDADIVLLGHTHDAWILPIQRERVNQKGTVEQDNAWYIKTPGYKDEYRIGEGGWHVEGGKPPKPIGAVWLKFYLDGDRIRVQPRLDIR